MTKENFMQNYAYTGVPVLIKNGTGNWTALRIFGYKYFKTLYRKLSTLMILMIWDVNSVDTKRILKHCVMFL